MTEQLPAATFAYTDAGPTDRAKVVHRLYKSKSLLCAVQVVREGGETNLHSHPHLDGVWFVLRGTARFYTTGDEVLGELGPHEGIVLPAGFPYWFEGVGDEALEILQIESWDRSGGAEERTDFAPLRPATIQARIDRKAADAAAGEGRRDAS